MLNYRKNSTSYNSRFNARVLFNKDSVDARTTFLVKDSRPRTQKRRKSAERQSV